MDEIFSMISEGTLKTYIEADYSLEEWKTALEHNAKPRMGKIIFKSSDRKTNPLALLLSRPNIKQYAPQPYS